jgi:ribonuclease BN (tRNA processing enzyme)
VRVTVLGCSGTFPGPASPCSAYLVEADGFRLVLDLGNGALGPLQRAAGLLDVDAIFVSHQHGDHCLDLLAYAYARHFHPDGAAPPLPVYGPRPIRDRLVSAFDSRHPELIDTVYDFRVLDGTRTAIGPFTVDLCRTAHPVETFAIRLSHAGRSFAYSADSGRCDPLVDLAHGSDVFACEASYAEGPDVPRDVHMTGRDAGEHAARAEVGRLVLTHVVPTTSIADVRAEAAQAFPGPVEVAASGATYAI